MKFSAMRRKKRPEDFKPIKAPKRTPKPPAPLSAYGPSDAATHAARKVLRRALREGRWDDQGGYSSYDGNGKWGFEASGIGNISPKELNTLFAFAGITPDEIEIVGHCSECANARVYPDGTRGERGYSAPCGSCLRPSHINNFVPLASLKRRTR